MSRRLAISTTSRRELSLRFFFLQGKAPKEFDAILTEILDCVLPNMAKDLSAPLYLFIVACYKFVWKLMEKEVNGLSFNTMIFDIISI